MTVSAAAITDRAVQYWGKRRGMYSNVMGFLGGVNFAILVARVCLMYPRACGATLVRKFFLVFSHWTWGIGNPIMICGRESGGCPALDALVWDSQTARGAELFPILTPCYPTSNSTFNVSVRLARSCTVRMGSVSTAQALQQWACASERRVPVVAKRQEAQQARACPFAVW